MDGDSRQKQISKRKLSKVVFNACSVLQSIWIRHSAILANNTDWNSLECQHRFILFSGFVLWVIHLFTQY